MRIKQAIIPAILALSAAASIMLGSAVPAAAASASSATHISAAHSYMFMYD